MSPAFKRYRDLAIVAVLLAVPFFVLKANMKSPENQGPMDRAVSRISAPIQAAAATLARGVGDVWNDYVYLVEVKRDSERLSYDNARLRVHTKTRPQSMRSARRSSARTSPSSFA